MNKDSAAQAQIPTAALTRTMDGGGTFVAESNNYKVNEAVINGVLTTPNLDLALKKLICRLKGQKDKKNTSQEHVQYVDLQFVWEIPTIRTAQ